MKNLRSSFIAIIPIFLFGNIIIAQVLNFEWVKQVGGPEAEIDINIALDDSSSVYNMGTFKGTLDFDPGQGTFNLTSAGGRDIYIQKLDVSGNLIWAKRFGGNGSESGNGIEVDDLGNIYVTGSFEQTVDFDPGAGISNLTSAGSNDVFIQKLDISGNLLWINHIKGTNFCSGDGISVDDSGNVYANGLFSGTVDFDSGPGTLDLTSAGSWDIYIQKLDASGNLIWTKQMGGPGMDYSKTISVDGLGNVYTGGVFEETVDFDPGAGTTSLTSLGGRDTYIQKLDASGNLEWINQLGSSWDESPPFIDLDELGNVYMTGSFSNTLDFDPGMGTLNLTPEGASDVYIQKLDSSGDLIWAKRIGGTGMDSSRGIAVDDLGNVYMTGHFMEIVDFDPGMETYDLYAIGDLDAYIQKLSSSGNFVFAKRMGGIDSETGSAIAIDNSGNLYVAGVFEGTVDFDPGFGMANLSSEGSIDYFIVKLNDFTVGNNELENSLGTLVYPNPASDFLNIDKGSNNKISVQLFNNLGQVIMSKNSMDQVTSLDLISYPSGAYFLSISNDATTTTYKIVKL